MTRSVPDVSVVVATRARPQLLRAALAAICRQDSASSIEIVVVFDQTPVDQELSRDVPLDGQSGPRRLILIRNDRTPGLAGARNAGVAVSQGRLLAFCDDDDTWYPAKLSTQERALAGTGATLSVCGIEIERGDRRVTRVPTPADVTVTELSRRRVMAAHPSTLLVTRAGFDRVGPVDEAIPGGYGEDYDWMLRALAGERVAVVEQPLVRVLWHKGSYFSTRWQTIIDALDYLVDKHSSIRESPQGLARVYGQKAFAYAALADVPSARHWARETLRLSKRERRAYLALAVSSRLLPASSIVGLANSRGRGI